MSSPITNTRSSERISSRMRVGDRLQVGHGRHGSGASLEAGPRGVAVLEQRRLVGEQAGRCAVLPSGIGDCSASSTAASISALTSSRIACDVDPERLERAGLAVDRVLARATPRPSRSGTYFMSSCAAWPCMRMVTASISVGPSPASARSRASRTASNIASGSLPSTRHAREAVGRRALDRVDRELLVDRRRVRVLVVLEHEDHRQLLHAGPVHRLVEVAARRRAVAEPRDRAALLAAQLERHRHARSRSASCRGASRPSRRSPSCGRRSGRCRRGRAVMPSCAAHVLGEDAPRLDAADDVGGEVAVQDAEAVLRGHRPRRLRRRRPPGRSRRRSEPGTLPWR